MSKEIVKVHPKLVKFRNSVEKRTTVRDVFVEPKFTMDYINSGSSVLNLLIGGSRLPNGNFVCPGWPKGTIVEIYGRESSGKSTVALSAMAQALFNDGKKDGCGLYVDLECAVKDNYSQKIGVDFRSPEQGGPGNALRAQPRTFEETEALVTNAALNGVDIIIIDSVAGLVSGREVARDTSDAKQKQGMAEVPRLMSNWLPKLQGIISRTGSLVIFLNQTRDKIGAMGFSEEALKSTTGGNALKFWSTVRVLLQPKLATKAKRFNPITKENEDVQIAIDILAKMIKNKVDAKQGHTGLFTIRYGVGIDELRTLLNIADSYNIIKRSKNAKKQDVFSYKTEAGELIEEIGLEKFRVSMQKTAGGLPMKEMKNKCLEKIVSGYEMISDDELASLADHAVAKRMDHDDDDDDHSPVAIDEQEDEDDLDLPDPRLEASDMLDAVDVTDV
jgi:protein RecA